MVWVAFRVFFGVMPLIAFASGIFWVGRGYGRLTPLGVAATVGAAICVPFAAVRLVAILGGVGSEVASSSPPGSCSLRSRDCF